LKLKVLIVDDEPLARRIIEGYCSHLSDLEVIASVADVFIARPVLESGKVDLLFIDINMPVLNGINFIRTLSEKPFTVFTTAYKEYAHEAFDLAATDYLLKPFSLERFIRAVECRCARATNGSPPCPRPFMSGSATTGRRPQPVCGWEMPLARAARR